MNFAATFETHARSAPDATALVDARSRWTFRRLNEYANRFANLLTERGIESGERVAFNLPNRVELAIALLGCLKAGVVAVPLNFRLTDDEILRLLNHASPKLSLLIAPSQRILDLYAVLTVDASAQSGSLWVALGKANPDFTSVGRQDADIANLLYTSGTTGLPKAAIHTHRMRNTIAGTMAHLFSLTRQDVGLAVSPMFHTGGLSVFCNAMYVGATVVLMEKWNVEDFARLLREEKVTFMHLVSTVVVDIVRAPASLFAGHQSVMRFTWGGGHATDRELFMKFEQRVGGLFLQGYSRTEGGITYNLLDPDRRTFAMNGYPSRNSSELDIYDHAMGGIAPQGQIGEIVVRGDGVSPGYWDASGIRLPTLYQDDWNGTGDMGFIDESGALHFLGREDHMIKTGGENVYPSEVGKVLMQIPGVSDAVVFDVPDDRLGQRIAAMVVPSDGSLTTEIVERFCREKLPGFKIPRSIALVEALPRLGSDKVDLNACRTFIAGNQLPEHLGLKAPMRAGGS